MDSAMASRISANSKVEVLIKSSTPRLDQRPVPRIGPKWGEIWIRMSIPTHDRVGEWSSPNNFRQDLEGSVEVAETDEDARSIDLQTTQSALRLQRARFPALERRACGAELAPGGED